MASTLTKNAFRADHLGSFLRSPEILALRASKPQSPELRAAEDREILRLLAKQKELGFDIFTDGEVRREGFMSDLVEAVDGFSNSDADARMWTNAQTKSTGKTQPLLDVVTAKIKQKRRLTEYETSFLLKNSPGPVKMTLPSSNQFPAIAYRKGASEKAYPTYKPFLADVAAIIAGEMEALAKEGVAYIQIDAPRYSYYLDEKWRTFLRTEYSDDLDGLLDEAIASDNLGFRKARTPGVILAIHLCRGNNKSNWYAQGGYDNIAEKVFSQLEVDRFLLEYDDERSGSFEPLRFVPKGKIVVLGLVTTKLGTLESADSLAKRIDAATKYLPLDQLALSPQCGFASMSSGNNIAEAEQWAKMKLVADVAKKVWG